MPNTQIGRKNLNLLPPEALIRTGEVDHADWNYRPLLGMIQRLRFRLIMRVLGARQFHRLLEIGYGSGVFMPELKQHCDELFGIDPHPHQDDVQRILAEHGVAAQLSSGSAESMPYPDGYFDAVVAVSAFEFIPDLAKACAEIRRVLAPGGVLVLVTPGHTPVVDLGLKIMAGKSAKDAFADRRQRIIPQLLNDFRLEQRVDYPPVAHRIVRLYTALRLAVNSST